MHSRSARQARCGVASVCHSARRLPDTAGAYRKRKNLPCQDQPSKSQIQPRPLHIGSVRRHRYSVRQAFPDRPMDRRRTKGTRAEAHWEPGSKTPPPSRCCSYQSRWHLLPFPNTPRSLTEYWGIAHPGAWAAGAATVAKVAAKPTDKELNFHLLFIWSPLSV